ncbi:MAG: DNA protection during starvation protein [Nitrosopumilus sp.]|nr:DNA protection during starvation protein [Nitrosopumilus sp.]
MGKKNIEIAGASDGTIEMLKKAYSLEMTAFHYWHYIDQYVEGLGMLHSDFFSESANDELGHAKKVAFRLDQLGAKATDNPQNWAAESGLGNLEPGKYLTLRSALEHALDFERYAIAHYNELAGNTQGKDHVTYHLALDLLSDEAKDEQDIEDILNRLEIS